MTVKETSNQNVLLEYLLSTHPSPLEVSTQNEHVYGTLNFKVTSNAKVLCDSITVVVPIGDTAVELFLKNPSPDGTTNSKQWRIHSEIEGGHELGLLDINCHVFTLKNGNPDHTVDDSFAFEIKGVINTIQGGDASVSLIEKSKAVGSKTFSRKTKKFSVSKSTSPEFYVRSFIAFLKSSPDLPISEFNNGETFQLSWESNGNSYEIYEKGQPKPIITTTETTCELTSGITTATTFIIKAICREQNVLDALTLTVSNPTLTPKSIDVEASVTVNGTTNLVGRITAMNAEVKGTMDVLGETTVKNAQVNGALNVDGKTTMTTLDVKSCLQVDSELTVNGEVNLFGKTTISNTEISKSLDAKSAEVSMFNKSEIFFKGLDTEVLSLKKAIAKTDGFLLYQPNQPLYKKPRVLCVLFSDKKQYSYGSMCIPVAAGTLFGCYVKNLSGKAETQVYWMPLGKASNGEKSYEVIEAPDIIPSDFTKQLAETSNKIEKERTEAGTNFLTKLESAFGQNINATDKTSLIEELLKL